MNRARCLAEAIVVVLALSGYAVGAQAPKPPEAERVVYVTKTGEKYHESTCRSLRKSRIKIALDEAKRRGFTACKVCKPPALP